MKKLGLLMALVTMVGFTACNSNSPDVDKKKMLIGKWELVSDIPEVTTYLFDERYMIETTYQGKETWLYSLNRQDGKLVISFGGRVNETAGVVEEIALTPRTILKLTSSELEWEYEVVGVAGPMTWHENFKKIE
jgi:hypothetical protein